MNILKINGREFNMDSPSSLEYKDQYIKSFEDSSFFNEVKVKWNHVNGFRMEIESNRSETFGVEIFDRKDSLIYETRLRSGMFCKLYPRYFNGIKYKIYSGDNVIKEEEIGFKNKKILIVFDTSSLGDTIAWIPYCEEFRKKHDCQVIVSTHLNYMFEKSYPDLIFVPPRTIVHNIFAMFNFGWYWNSLNEPENPVTIPLQKTASNILGLEYKEIQTKIHFNPKKNPYDQKYVCIATNSTAGCKHWNHPEGWKNLSSYLIKRGYKIVNVSKNGEKIEGVENIKDDSMLNTMNVIYHSEFMIGLSSGLSWLAWSLGKKVVMISNFTEKDHEFTNNCTRITNPDVCNGCWNNPLFVFDKGDWNWCPEHKGTERQFECHKSITPGMVISQIQHLLS